MAVTRKGWRVIFILIGVVLLLVLLYAYRDKLFGRTIKDPNLDNEPVPQGSPTPKWVPESFPLNVGMYGIKIAKLQEVLGIEDDGKFGIIETKPAVISAGYSVPLSESDYNKIVNPVSTAGGNNFSDLKKALQGGYTAISGGILYPIQGQNKKYKFQFYSNGRWAVAELDSNTTLKKGSYYNGGQKMSVDGGATYNSGAYSNMQNIIKTTLND